MRRVLRPDKVAHGGLDPVIQRLHRLIAANFVGIDRPEEIVDWAMDALEAGLDTPSLRVVAALPGSVALSELTEHFTAMLRELDWEPGRPHELVTLHAVALARALVDGELDPSTATHRFENEILARFGHPAVLERWCHLHGGFLTDPYRELEGSELDAAVRREARTVLEKAEDGTLSEALSEQLRPRVGDGGDAEWRTRTRGICWRA